MPSKFYTLIMNSCRVDNLATLEFDRNRKSMSVIVTKNGSGQIHRPVTRRSTREHVTGNSLLVKGAAECILSRCNSVSPVLHKFQQLQ